MIIKNKTSNSSLQYMLPGAVVCQHLVHALELQFHKHEVHDQLNISQRVLDMSCSCHISASATAQQEYPVTTKKKKNNWDTPSIKLLLLLK